MTTMKEMQPVINDMWAEPILAERLNQMPDQEVAKRLSEAKDSLGAWSVLSVIDAQDGFETPKPPSGFVAAAALSLFYGHLTHRGDRIE